MPEQGVTYPLAPGTLLENLITGEIYEVLHTRAVFRVVHTGNDTGVLCGSEFVNNHYYQRTVLENLNEYSRPVTCPVKIRKYTTNLGVPRNNEH